MLLISNIFLLLVNAVTSRREYTILFNRVAIFILLYSGIIGHGSLYVTCLDTGIGIYNGLFHSATIINSLDFTIPAMLEQGINGQLYQDCLNHFTLTTLVSPVIIYSDLVEQILRSRF